MKALEFKFAQPRICAWHITVFKYFPFTHLCTQHAHTHTRTHVPTLVHLTCRATLMRVCEMHSESLEGIKPRNERRALLLRHHQISLDHQAEAFPCNLQKSPLVCVQNYYGAYWYMYVICMYIVRVGEDEVSFERHNNFLRKEHSKVRPNAQVVKELMATTFSMRRADILASACDVQTLFKKYPFLNDVNQVCALIIIVVTVVHM